MNTFEDLVTAFHDGRITGDQFFRDTYQTWMRIARYLHRRWPLPAWVTDEELVQELMIGAFESIWRYSEHRAQGTTVARYVEWNAIDAAKKKLHKMRGANLHGNRDSNPSRFEISVSAFGDVTPEWIDGLLVQEAEQHMRLEQARAEARALAACETECERYTVRALAETEDLVEAATLIYEDPETRAACGLTDAAHAGASVAAAAYAVAERLEAA
jgi:DNA-directed RNA polymerase specialized sigma24 family protein